MAVKKASMDLVGLSHQSRTLCFGVDVRALL